MAQNVIRHQTGERELRRSFCPPHLSRSRFRRQRSISGPLELVHVKMSRSADEAFSGDALLSEDGSSGLNQLVNSEARLLQGNRHERDESGGLRRETHAGVFASTASALRRQP